MTREETAERIKVMQAYVDGKKIQWAYNSTDIWHDADYPHWKPNVNYRIKPESKYRPFANGEECWLEMLKHQPFGFVIFNECYTCIVSVSNIDVSMTNMSGDIITQPFGDLTEDYTFADGTPFGIKED